MAPHPSTSLVLDFKRFCRPRKKPSLLLLLLLLLLLHLLLLLLRTRRRRRRKGAALHPEVLCCPAGIPPVLHACVLT
jgi:hypothetical protein